MRSYDSHTVTTASSDTNRSSCSIFVVIQAFLHINVVVVAVGLLPGGLARLYVPPVRGAGLGINEALPIADACHHVIVGWLQLLDRGWWWLSNALKLKLGLGLPSIVHGLHVAVLLPCVPWREAATNVVCSPPRAHKSLLRLCSGSRDSYPSTRTSYY